MELTVGVKFRILQAQGHSGCECFRLNIQYTLDFFVESEEPNGRARPAVSSDVDNLEDLR